MATHVQTSTFTVLASRYRKSSDGKITAYLQVQSHPNAPVGFVRVPTTNPPLAGTRITVTGSVIDSPQGPVMNVAGESSVKALSGQQGQILHKTIKTLLDRFGIAHDAALLEANLQNPAVHLASMEKHSLIDALAASSVIDAHAVVEAREETFADALTRNFFHGLEPIRLPYDTDSKRELPFMKGTWPKEVMQGCLPSFLESTKGKKPHPAIANGRAFNLTKYVTYDGVDNFFRALAVAGQTPDIFTSWIRDKSRPSTLTQCYIEDKQAHGTQIFTSSDMKQLERLGLNSPAKIAARLGSMVQLPTSDNSLQLMPLGSYQSSTSLAQLSKLEKHATALSAPIVDSHLDPFQKKALHAFMQGKPLTLISGPPGTGKSTLISSMIEHHRRSDAGPIVILAPTGKAAARLNAGFEKDFDSPNRPVATTIHGMFYNTAVYRKTHRSMPTLNTAAIRDALDSKATDAFPVNVERAMRFSSYRDKKEDVAKPQPLLIAETMPAEILRGATVIVDESTQVTSDVLALLLEMRPKKLVLTGDLSQLKPVGPGKPFHDLVALAKEGYAPDQVNAVELQIDHRATKELSDFTRKLRAGEIPLDYVEQYSGDASATAAQLQQREAAVLECKRLGHAMDVVEQLTAKTVEQQNARFNVIAHDQTASNLSPIKITEKFSPDTFVHTLVSPSLMAMAYTNAEVGQLNDRVASVVRPLMSSGQSFAGLPAMAPIAASGIFLGDAVLQTENSRQRLVYTTPGGSRISSATMNGESFVLLGAHTWLPLPGNYLPPNVSSLWSECRLDDKAMDIAIHRADDPSAHLELIKSLQELNSPAASKLLALSLSEVLFVDQTKLTPGQPLVLDVQDFKRMVLPPMAPKKMDREDPEFNSFMSVVNHVWKIDVAGANAKPGRAGLIDYAAYKRAHQQVMDGIESLTLGFAYTVHKAQGSQAKVAISVAAPPAREDDASNHEASVYTGTTRAQESSFLLIHGTTAEKLNSQWAHSRQLESQKPSPIRMLASGLLSPMASTLKLTTATPPQRKDEALDLSQSAFRKKATLASHGLPTTLDLSTSPAYARQNMAMLISNNIMDISGRPTLPGMVDIGQAPPQALPRRKLNFVWDPSQAPGYTPQPTDVDLAQVLDSVDFSFDN